MPSSRPCSKPSAAILLNFLQLAAPRQSVLQSGAQLSSPTLEYLLPRFTTTGPATRRIFSSHPSVQSRTNFTPISPSTHQTTTTTTRTTPTYPAPIQSPIIFARRLSSTPSNRRTVPIHNPPSDPSVSLEITQRAASRLSTISAKDSNPNLALRIQVESGGCHGFQYLMSLVTLPEDLSSSSSSATGEDDKNTLREDDTIFSYVHDSVAENSAEEAELKKIGAKIILDGPSLDLLKGSNVDFTQELIGSQFKIVDNPLATSSCGCGTSFDIKLD
ncbi:hypothetical protein MKZ38_009522 [Zalerion maritima]|uniref:FeS cluster biogenesis domain-containing protein n=1 Tax=Zalerion maritima TaxID=339359 RepID=A0AAD5RT97_9PEZI|nr:hypothetical protein MKZ38_009522 [Zalerion maritima]